MAKLFLKFEEAVLKEFSLSQGVVSIGRLPDNVIPIDNLAVSGHHARIYWETDHYVVEDNNSLNGTYVNNRRVSRAVLKDGDALLIGKHIIEFKDAWHEEAPADRTVGEATTPLPSMHATVVLDTKKAKEMLAGVTASPAAAAAAAAGAPGPATGEPAAPLKERIGALTVVEGKTEEPRYILTSKLTVIGASDQATVKLKGWFVPKVAAIISKRENRYFIASQDKKAKVKVNFSDVAGQRELTDGDMVEVAGVKMTFGYSE